MAHTVDAKGTPGKGRRAKGPRFKRTENRDELWRAVLAHCAREFEESLGRPWIAMWEGLGMTGHALETEAHAVFVALRRALNAAAAFIERPDVLEAPRQGAMLHALLDWVPRCIMPLLEYEWLSERAEKGWRRPLENRAQLVHMLDRKNVFDVQRPDGSSRFLTLHEIAIVSLLAGNRPPLPRELLDLTPAAIIKLETQRIRPHLRKYGMPGVEGRDRGGPSVPCTSKSLIVGPMLPPHARRRAAKR